LIPGPVLDGLLALILVALAGYLLRVPDLFRAGIAFIVFGLLMAAAWLRLEAPDLALAEAAIGAGITGALYLNTLAGMGEHPEETGPAAPGAGLLSGILALGLGGTMALIAGNLVLSGAGTTAPLGGTGKLTNPVTAVLLDVRAYDTLLETAVLVEALIGIWVLGRAPEGSREGVPPPLRWLVGILAPLMILVAGVLLWQGTTGTGGAFQSAAVLAAAGILARLSGLQVPLLEHPRAQAGLASLGTGVFLAIGLAVMAAGGAFLEYPPAWQGPLVLTIEALAAVSIAVVLVLLFEATGPKGPSSEKQA